MTNAELIKALRYCSDNEKQDECDECPYLHNGMCRTMLSDAAYALEAAEKFSAELIKNIEHWRKQVIKLRAQLPKEGEWIPVGDGTVYVKCSVCGEEMCCRGHYCPNCGAKMDGERKDGEHEL